MIKILQYEHVGIRVSNLPAALVFYKKLGFVPDPGANFPDYRALELINEVGIRINLIYTAEKFRHTRNILIDAKRKFPGITHVAFIVADIAEVVRELTAESICITEGPVTISSRRSICFVRDPDGNVIEFDQLLRNGPD